MLAEASRRQTRDKLDEQMETPLAGVGSFVDLVLRFRVDLLASRLLLTFTRTLA